LKVSRDCTVPTWEQYPPSFDTTLGAVAVTEFLRIVTGFAGSDAPADRINSDLARGTATRMRGKPSAKGVWKARRGLVASVTSRREGSPMLTKSPSSPFDRAG
jgi:hypothetical protein